MLILGVKLHPVNHPSLLSIVLKNNTSNRLDSINAILHAFETLFWSPCLMVCINFLVGGVFSISQPGYPPPAQPGYPPPGPGAGAQPPAYAPQPLDGSNPPPAPYPPPAGPHPNQPPDGSNPPPAPYPPPAYDNPAYNPGPT